MPRKSKKSKSVKNQTCKVEPALKISIAPVYRYPFRNERTSKNITYKVVCTQKDGSQTNHEVFVPDEKGPPTKKAKRRKEKKEKEPEEEFRWVYIKQMLPSKRLIVSLVPFNKVTDKETDAAAKEIEKRLLQDYPNTHFSSSNNS